METKQIKVYEKQTSVIVERANELTIKTEPQMEMAADYLREIKVMAKKIKAEKEKLTKPAMEILNHTREIFRQVESNYKEGERIIKDKMIDFDEKKQAQADKKLKKLEEDIKAGKTDIVEAAKKAETITPKKEYAGQSGVVQYRQVKTIVITDEARIPRQYLQPNDGLIKTTILAGTKIAGVELRITKQVVAR